MTTIQQIIKSLSTQPSWAALDSLSNAVWEDMAVTAIALGLAPLLHWRLTQAQISPPPLTLAKLVVTRQAHAKRNEAIGQQLAELLAAFAHQKIDVLVLKGA